MSKKTGEYNLRGVIIEPGKYDPNSERRIKVRTEKGNEYTCLVPKTIFSNFQEDDIIECRVVSNDDKTFTLTRTPFTQFSVDRNAIEKCFIRGLRGTGFGAKGAQILYDGLKNLAKHTGYAEPVQQKKPISEEEEEEEDTKIKKKVIKKKEDLSSNKSDKKKEDDKKSSKRKEDEEDEEDDDNKKKEDDKKSSKRKEDDASSQESEDEEEKTSNSKIEIPGMPKSTLKKKLVPEIVGYDGVIPLLSELANRFRTGDRNSIATLITCGIRENQAEALLNWWYKSRSLRRLHLLGLNNKEIEECKMDYDEIYQAILINPFKLAPLPLEKCSELMLLLNKEVTDDHFRCGEILRKIYSYVHNNSYTCVLLSTIEYHFPKVHKYLTELTKNYGVILDGRHLYLEYNYTVEIFVTNMVDSLIKQTAAIAALPVDDTASVQTAKYTNKTLTEEQKLAITGGIHNKICVITGPAGTGKSTIAKEIFNNFDLRGIRMVPCAFTGKAVARLNKCFGQKIAKTIDFMIMRSSQIEPFDVVLIDECSMVTTELIYRFKKAFPFEFSMILVGDCNQLPPISWGFFMKQIIACERVPIYTLTKNQRIVKHTMTEEEEIDQNKKSKGKDPASVEFDRTILENCERLIDPDRNLSEPMEFKQGNGFFTLNGELHTIESILNQLSNLFEAQDITCISPYNEYIKSINTMFQNIFLEDVKTVIDSKNRCWKIGDRVMMLKNNYNINIMNGEEGYIVNLESTGVKVQFEDGVEHLFLYKSKNGNNYETADDTTEASWNSDELVVDMIQQSFCVSVHKSQGSEYRIVLIFIPERTTKKGTISTFLNINLLYTAITRVKQAVWIISPEGVLEQISQNKLPIRVDNLAGRLLKMKDEELEKPLNGLTEMKFVRQFTVKEDSEEEEDDIPFDFDE